jgi:hypothetical protein
MTKADPVADPDFAAVRTAMSHDIRHAFQRGGVNLLTVQIQDSGDPAHDASDPGKAGESSSGAKT